MNRNAQPKLAVASLDTVAPKEIVACAKPSNHRRVASTTYERDYSTDDRELIQAMHEYKQRSGRMFPTWSEVLEVLQGLGYQKQA